MLSLWSGKINSHLNMIALQSQTVSLWQGAGTHPSLLCLWQPWSVPPSSHYRQQSPLGCSLASAFAPVSLGHPESSLKNVILTLPPPRPPVQILPWFPLHLEENPNVLTSVNKAPDNLSFISSSSPHPPHCFGHNELCSVSLTSQACSQLRKHHVLNVKE